MGTHIVTGTKATSMAVLESRTQALWFPLRIAAFMKVFSDVGKVLKADFQSPKHNPVSGSLTLMEAFDVPLQSNLGRKFFQRAVEQQL